MLGEIFVFMDENSHVHCRSPQRDAAPAIPAHQLERISGISSGIPKDRKPAAGYLARSPDLRDG